MKTILLVGDDTIMLEHCKELLENDGFAVITTIDALRGVDCLSGGTAIDCVVTDYRMPGCGGLEMASLIRARGYTTPIILMDSDLTELAIELGTTLGIRFFLEKTHIKDTLNAAVKICTGSYQNQYSKK